MASTPSFVDVSIPAARHDRDDTRHGDDRHHHSDGRPHDHWGRVAHYPCDLAVRGGVDQDVGMDLASVDVHELRADERDAVRSLILDGLQQHWGTVDPTLNPDLDDLAATYAAGRVLVAAVAGTVAGTGTVTRRDDETAEIVRMSVAPEYRRAGLGRRLVADLVATARTGGCRGSCWRPRRTGRMRSSSMCAAASLRHTSSRARSASTRGSKWSSTGKVRNIRQNRRFRDRPQTCH